MLAGSVFELCKAIKALDSVDENLMSDQSNKSLNSRKILAVSTQLNQLRKESLKKIQPDFFFMLSFRNCLSCVLTVTIVLLFNLSSAAQNICFIYSY